MNTKMHIIHDNLEHLSEIDKGKIEEIEKNYNSKSEEIFKEIWDISDTSSTKLRVLTNASAALSSRCTTTMSQNYSEPRKPVMSQM